MTANLVRLEIPASAIVGIEFGRTSARVIEPNVSIEEIGSMIDQATAMGDSVRWWVGDLLLYAEARWGEESAQLLNMMRISERQASNYRYIAEKVAPSRRRENLSFSHHEAVASLPAPDQTRLLALAENTAASVIQFREVVRDHKAFEATPDPPPSRTIVLAQDTTAVDAVRGLRQARDTLRTVGSTSPEVSENLHIPEAVRGIDQAAKIVRRADLLEDVLVAASELLAAGVVQIGLPDPAVIVPTHAWDKLHAAHERATEGRRS